MLVVFLFKLLQGCDPSHSFSLGTRDSPVLREREDYGRCVTQVTVAVIGKWGWWCRLNMKGYLTSVNSQLSLRLTISNSILKCLMSH